MNKLTIIRACALIALVVTLYTEFLSKITAALDFDRTYATISSRFYQLQVPNSPRLWILVHLIHATCHVALTADRAGRFGYASEPVFRSSHWLFVLIVALQLTKLAQLSRLAAACVNGILLALLIYFDHRRQYVSYLTVLAIPLVLGVVAILFTLL